MTIELSIDDAVFVIRLMLKDVYEDIREGVDFKKRLKEMYPNKEDKKNRNIRYAVERLVKIQWIIMINDKKKVGDKLDELDEFLDDFFSKESRLKFLNTRNARRKRLKDNSE